MPRACSFFYATKLNIQLQIEKMWCPSASAHANINGNANVNAHANGCCTYHVESVENTYRCVSVCASGVLVVGG
jgi:hypothetical protein